MVEKSQECQKHANAEETRAAILAAALEEFAIHSVDGARTREIARKAKVNHAAINYHFGGKDEMYFKIIRETIDTFEEKFRPIYAEVEDFLAKDGKDKAKAIDLIKRILILHHDIILSPSFPWFYLLLRREEIFPTKAFDLVFKRSYKPAHQNFAKLVDIATEFKLSPKENSMMAVGLMSLNGALTSCKTPFLKLNCQESITKEDLELFKNLIVTSVDKLLQ